MILKKIFCKHDFNFITNLYGDVIIAFGYKRSIWKCKKCNKIKLEDYLNEM